MKRFDPLRRRLALAAVAGGVLASTTGNTLAQSGYPSRPVRMVIAFPAGGATDILGRALGQKLSEAIGQPIVVENKPGAGGMIGLETAAKAAPDGYTIFLCAFTNQAIAGHLYANAAYELERDFVPVSLIASVPHVLVVNAGVPAKTVAELVEWIKSNRSAVNFASQGNGTLSHLESELLKQRLGLEMTHVPYKGSTDAHPDLIAGTTSLMFDSLPASLPHVRSGKLRALAVAATQRSALAPELPTLIEAGVAGYEVDNLFGIFVPKGTPADIVARLDAEFAKLVKSADLRERLLQQGVDLMHGGPQKLSAAVDAEKRKWGKTMKDANIGARN